ncbi:MAG: hypothetical protein WBV46_04805 [Terriglobales bacterium]
MLTRACLTLALLIGAPSWAQTDTTGTTPASPVSDPTMLTPPPVTGQSYPTALGAETRSNYLRYGVSFTSAYTDNALGGSTPVSDVSYSITPTIALDETTPTIHSVLTYSPGFTLYQRLTSRDEADENVSLNLADRLSPHFTLTARDSLQKSSSAFNQPDFGSGGVSGGSQGGNNSIIAPISPLLSNSSSVGVSYQFAANGMVGATGTFTNLHYYNTAEVSGLADSSTQSGSAFYSLRLSRLHYIGVDYQYQRLVSSSSTQGQSETQTQSVQFFYTLYLTSHISISAFGGPQYSNTTQPAFLGASLPPATAWNPSVGGSFSWQGERTNVALSYSQAISGGGGLNGAVHMDSANASLRQQITRTLNASVSAAYTQNNLVSSPLLGGSNNGHSIMAAGSVSRQFGDHLTLQVGYTRLHQDYSGVAVLAATPNTNRESVSLSYQFSRPLGR